MATCFSFPYPSAPNLDRPKRSRSGTTLLAVLLLLPLFGGGPPHETRRSRSDYIPKSLDKSVAPDPRLASAYAALRAKDLPGAYRLSVLAEQHRTPRRVVLPLQTEIFRAADYLDKEIEALRQWTVLAPRDPLPWLKLFYIYLDLGWKHEAKNAAHQAHSRAPHHPRCYVARALLAYRSSDPSAGLPAIAEAQRLEPGNLEFADLHASLLLKALRFREAETLLRTMLKTDFQSKTNRLSLAQALLGQNKTAEAAGMLRTLQQQDPDNVPAAYQLGILAQQKHDQVEAMRQFSKAAALDSQYSNVMWYLGRLSIQQGKAEEGRKLLKLFARMDANTSDYETLLKRLETRPDDARLHYRLAHLHQGADELAQATVELRRTLQIQPRDTAARKDLAAVLIRAGRATEAHAVTVVNSRP